MADIGCEVLQHLVEIGSRCMRQHHADMLQANRPSVWLFQWVCHMQKRLNAYEVLQSRVIFYSSYIGSAQLWQT